MIHRLTWAPGSWLRGALLVLLLISETEASLARGLPEPVEVADWMNVFEAHGVTGTFVLFDEAAGTLRAHNLARARTPYLPASTFKIPNAAIALQTGVIPSRHHVMRWDGQVRSITAWNRDHDLASAIRYSAVWYFQELARRIGPNRMDHYLQAFDYGNRDIGGGIDQFWLSGQIRISASQQIAFLRRMAHGHLPLAASVIEQVHLITYEQGDDRYALHAKTGWAIAMEPDIGWYVGWVTRPQGLFVFAINIDMDTRDKVPLRRRIAHDILLRGSIIPEERTP